MPWARVDDQWWCHPKAMGLSLAASGLWVKALSWSCAQRRDVIPVSLVEMLGGTDVAAELVTAGLWVDHPDGWRIHDWAEYQQATTSEKRAEAGRKGGMRPSPHAGKTQATSKQTASKQASNDQANEQAGVPSRPDPSQQQQNTRPANPRPQPPTRPPAVSEFERFWNAWPTGRKVGRPKAEKAHTRAVLAGHTPAAILDGAERWADHWARDGTEARFIPHPTTWLNEHRWNDNPPQPATTRTDRNAAARAQLLGTITPALETG